MDESTGNRKHQFLNGPQVDMVLADEVFSATGSPSDILWLLQDHQNSVTDVATIPASGQAQLVNHIEYNAFGAITSQSNSTWQPLQTYTGQIQDDAIDLLYYDARWYDPQLAKFTSEDPIGFLGGDVNLQRYVGNSMIRRRDPSGLWNESGHFYTTYFIARLAHLDHSEALQIAAYSQLPDERADLDAAFLFLNCQDPATFNAAVGRITADDAERIRYTIRIQRVLHSLTGQQGENVRDRRRRLGEIIREALANNDYLLAGLAIHSLGDAFAHSSQNDGIPCLYPTGRGHGLQGHNPDQIRSHFDAYKEYFDTLADIFGVNELELKSGTVQALLVDLRQANSDQAEIDVLTTAGESIFAYDDPYRPETPKVSTIHLMCPH